MDSGMARTKNSATVNLDKSVELTAGLIERLKCPSGKDQVFLRDTKSPSLRVRATNGGARSFVFEAKLNRKTIRRTIGDVRTWTIEQARVESNRLRVLLDGGVDPREVEKQKALDQKAAEDLEISKSLTFRTAWDVYLDERKSRWGDRTYLDHIKLSNAGGKVTSRGTRGKGVTIAGPLYSLMHIRLVDLNQDLIEAWAKEQGVSRPTYGRLAFRCLKAFINWAENHPDFKYLISHGAASSRRARESFGKPSAKADVLQREQLKPWFKEVKAIQNPIVSAALQAIVILGARPGEVLSLKWEDIDFKWRTINIRDKVEGKRLVPITNYLYHLLNSLPRTSDKVFASAFAINGNISPPRKQHVEACSKAGIYNLTLNGLRRSFGSLSEWLNIPSGVVAQIMGHAASAIAEKHYRVRPIELLRHHHQLIENWILTQAEISFEIEGDFSPLQLISA